MAAKKPLREFIAIALTKYGSHPLNGEERDTGGEAEAVNRAAKYINEHRGDCGVGIYQLVSVVKAEKIPIKVEKFDPKANKPVTKVKSV